jgi:hypothetical protein
VLGGFVQIISSANLQEIEASQDYEEAYYSNESEEPTDHDVNVEPVEQEHSPGYTLEVTCSEYARSAYYSGYISYDGTPDVLEIDIKIINNMSSPITIQQQDFSVYDSEGNQYKQTNTYNGGHYQNLIYKHLNPRVEEHFTLFFDILGESDYKLAYDGELVALSPKHLQGSCRAVY